MAPAIPLHRIADQSISLGASLVGVARVKTLLASPSHRLIPVGQRIREAASVVVLALAHPEKQPGMDLWDNRKGRTPGNRQLISIARKLAKWLRRSYSTEAAPLPYNANRGGVFLKDAAVLAGLGVMGRNNLLITPQFGPRVRLGALLLKRSLPETGPLEGFAPCRDCHRPCMQACPQKAFHGGSYQVQRCLLQMKKDEARKIVLKQPVIGMPPRLQIAYCRRCELSCPVGSDSGHSGISPRT